MISGESPTLGNFEGNFGRGIGGKREERGKKRRKAKSEARKKGEMVREIVKGEAANLK